MPNYTNEYQRLMASVRAKASHWRHAQPPVADFNRTVKSWRGSLEQLQALDDTDARVKAALEFVDALPYEGRVGPIAAKSAAELFEKLNDEPEQDAWQPAWKRHASKALEFRSEWEGGESDEKKKR